MDCFSRHGGIAMTLLLSRGLGDRNDKGLSLRAIPKIWESVAI